ncbi:hypothetical protein [Streptomyces sp. NPDC094149]|uniref:hypothetical protein n=1 Tax=Streptomyces sp. NPDC094149 TaxID=3155079 RepID=UPI00332AF86F
MSPSQNAASIMESRETVRAKASLWPPVIWRGKDRELQLLLRLSRDRLTDYGLPTPAPRVLAAHPTTSGDLLSRLGHGDITVKTAPTHADASHVSFEDGTSEEIDAIIYCTGYDIAFPFLDDELINLTDNDAALYRRVVSLDQPGLYFIGLIQPLGAIMPVAEVQSHWVPTCCRTGAHCPDGRRCSTRSAVIASERPAATSPPTGTRTRWTHRRTSRS